MEKSISKFLLITFMTIIIFSPISYCKYIIDKNLIAGEIRIDKTLPTGLVQYSMQDDGGILVTITLSEPINDVEGWIVSENRLTITKVYDENIAEEIVITDMSGNKNTIEVNNEND